MFSAMAVARPLDISAVPGAPWCSRCPPGSRALHAPQVPTIAFTGDGGLMMCAGELATTVQHGARLCVDVFKDGAYAELRKKPAALGRLKPR